MDEKNQLSGIDKKISETDQKTPDTRVNARIIIKGIVQGVYFRVNTRKAAREHCVYGWVRNNRDGSVEAVFEGQKENVEGAVEWCRQGPPGARVDEVELRWTGKIENFKSFHIDYESS